MQVSLENRRFGSVTAVSGSAGVGPHGAWLVGLSCRASEPEDVDCTTPGERQPVFVSPPEHEDYKHGDQVALRRRQRR